MHLIDNSNAFSKIAKIFSRKCFGEDVSKLFSCLTIMQLNFAFLLYFSDKIILDGNMLWSFMADWILGNCNCWFVITIQNSPFFCFSPMSSNILLSQIAWEAALDAETYSVSAVDWATTLCFFYNQEQMLDANKKA